jgi:FkbM family methyltransferase
MNLRRFARKCISGLYILRAKAQPSFSQVGEDLVINYLFQLLRIKQPAYLDIGANFPVVGNNTYFFYNKGCKGVCIEPDPELYEKIRKARPADTVLNAGIGLNGNSSADLYIFPHPYTGWNTFSKPEAEKKERETGIRPREIRSTPLKTINEVIAAHFDSCPNLISIDVEGLDLDILRTLDFSKYKPEVICAETLSFSIHHHQEEKIGEIGRFLETKGYFVFADTYVNTIFCLTNAYKPIPE